MCKIKPKSHASQELIICMYFRAPLVFNPKVNVSISLSSLTFTDNLYYLCKP